MTKNSIIEKVSAQHYQFQNNLKLYQYLLLKILYAHTDRFLPSSLDYQSKSLKPPLYLAFIFVVFHSTDDTLPIARISLAQIDTVHCSKIKQTINYVYKTQLNS